MVPGQLQTSDQGGSASLNLSEPLSNFPSYYVTMGLCVCLGWKSEGSLCLLAPRGLDRKASLWKNLPFQSSWAMDINGWQLSAAEWFRSDPPSQKKPGTLWNCRPWYTVSLVYLANEIARHREKGWVRGEEEHSLARNLLNFEARTGGFARGGERRFLACPRQINHDWRARPKANYVECFLGKSSRRLCKSPLALEDMQIRLGAD